MERVGFLRMVVGAGYFAPLKNEARDTGKFQLQLVPFIFTWYLAESRNVCQRDEKRLRQ